MALLLLLLLIFLMGFMLNALVYALLLETKGTKELRSYFIMAFVPWLLVVGVLPRALLASISGLISEGKRVFKKEAN